MTRWLVALAIALAAPADGLAKPIKAEGLMIDDAYTRPTPRGKPGDPIPAGAAFVTIENKSDKTYQLVGASSPIAGQVEIQQAQRYGKSVRTRRVLSLNLAPGDRIAMGPESEYRLALIGLRRKMEDGDVFPLVLEFEGLGKVEVEVEAKYEVYTDTGPRYNQRAKPQ
ncbi:MAG: copper chaperone PCu(A)C [Alphaproteobacteria bacterium]|nr:copper chaperone PCu(A)C [Alphaproteobacteria bacterium]